MLEVKNLYKTYKTKLGVTCQALKSVNLKFQDHGLIFLLGKSGSGKSTFLNVVGGLDVPDGGEIIISGKSSKTFTQKDFDSYRNTYVGFIFQEYNILNDFSVYENISLALELQGKKGDKEDMDRLLKIVGIEGMGNRKPNELSGGQKQRIAIARALIKNPDIIFADEPTGNLDSNTGKQVFTFLKELAKEKLIVVVSHDRESAEMFGERIIELHDGSVISDVTKSNIGEEWEPTKCIKIEKNKTCELISAKLPMAPARKIAFNSIKNKKGRLFVTILLIVISVSLFGFTQILSNYNLVDSSISTFNKLDLNAIMVRQGKMNEMFDFFERSHEAIDEEQITYLEDKYSETLFSKVVPINGGLFFSLYNTGNNFMPNSIKSLIVSSEDSLNQMGYGFVGRYPSEEKEVVITDFLAFMTLMYYYDIYGLDKESPLVIFTETFSRLDNKILKTYKTNKLALLEKMPLLLSGSFEGIEEFQNKELLNYIFSVFSEVLLDNVTTIKIGTTKYALTGIISTGFGQYLDLINAKQEDLIQDERILEIYYQIENIHTSLFVNDKFLNTIFKDGANFGSHYLSKTENTGRNMLENVKVSYNKKWLAENPVSGEIINEGKESYIVTDSIVQLSENEVIVSDNYLTSLYGGGAKFDTDEDFYEKDYKYNFAYQSTNKKLDFKKEEKSILKIVGVFNYWETLSQNKDKDEENDVFIDSTMTMVMFANDTFYSSTSTVLQKVGSLFFALPKSYFTEKALLNELCSTKKDGLMMYHHTGVSEPLYLITDIIFVFQILFRYLSYILGVFSVLLLINFMTTSVMSKKRDIGVLRALGARSNDIAKIFLIEASVIGSITIFFTCILMVGLTKIVNLLMKVNFIKFLKNEIINILELLTLSVPPFLIVIAIIAIIISLATLIPVRKIAKMSPVDAIKK